MIQILKENNWQPRLLYPANLFSRIKRELKTFQDEHKLKEFIVTKPALLKILKEILHIQEIKTNIRAGERMTLIISIVKQMTIRAELNNWNK